MSSTLDSRITGRVAGLPDRRVDVCSEPAVIEQQRRPGGGWGDFAEVS